MTHTEPPEQPTPPRGSRWGEFDDSASASSSASASGWGEAESPAPQPADSNPVGYDDSSWGYQPAQPQPAPQPLGSQQPAPQQFEPQQSAPRQPRWKVPAVIVAALVIIAAAGVFTWQKLGKDSETGTYAAGTPEHAGSATISSLTNPKIALGFALPDQYGKQMNARRITHGGVPTYLSATVGEGSNRHVRITGQDARGESMSTVVTVNPPQKAMSRQGEIPLSPSADCLVEGHKAQCESFPPFEFRGTNNQPDQESAPKQDTPDAADTAAAPRQHYPSPLEDSAADPDADTDSDGDYYPSTEDALNSPTVSPSDLPSDAQGKLPDSGEPVWVFNFPDPHEEDTNYSVIIHPNGILSYKNDQLITDIPAPAGFAELNRLDAVPVPLVLDKMLIYATPDGVHGLDVDSGNSPWKVDSKLDDWWVEDGHVLTLEGNTLNQYELRSGDPKQEMQSVSAPHIPDAERPLTVDDFANSSFGVPVLDNDGKVDHVEQCEFQDGVGKYHGRLRPGSDSQDWEIKVSGVQPFSHEGKEYALVTTVLVAEKLKDAGTYGFHVVWAIFDKDKNYVHAWNERKLESLKFMGPGDTKRVGLPYVADDTFFFPRPPLKSASSMSGLIASCTPEDHCVQQSLRLRWVGEEIAPLDTLISYRNQEVSVPPNQDPRRLFQEHINYEGGELPD